MRPGRVGGYFLRGLELTPVGSVTFPKCGLESCLIDRPEIVMVRGAMWEVGT